MRKPLQEDEILRATRQWVETFVVEMNLCPFAKRELVKDRVRFKVTYAVTEEELLTDLQRELIQLNGDRFTETTLLIHPGALQDFNDYNQFLDYADSLLIAMKLESSYQVASFHPDYRFNDTQPDDAENYTNRSPYPTLHLLRQDTMEQAIANYPNVDDIPERNIALMNSLGRDKLQALWQACFDGSRPAG